MTLAMKGYICISFVCLASYLCFATELEDLEKKEEDLYARDVKANIDLYGEDEVWYLPGTAPLKGNKAVLKFFEMLKANDYERYNTTKIQEYDMGTHLMQILAVTTLTKRGTLRDHGEMLKFYERVNGNPVLRIAMDVSLCTPWPGVPIA